MDQNTNSLSENKLSISELLIILVDLSAVWIYKAQERDKIKDAASLIVLQIDELQIRVQEIQSFITEKGLIFEAFYKPLPLIDTNYWSEYKHLLIRKIANKSYNDFNLACRSRKNCYAICKKIIFRKATRHFQFKFQYI